MGESVLDRVSCPPGTQIFDEGDIGDRAYVVQDGEVNIFKIINGEEVVLGTVGKGGIFGEMALIDDNPRMAAARTVGASTLIIITRTIFEKKLAKTDPFVRGLLKILVQNIRSISKAQFDSGDDDEYEDDEEDEMVE